MGGVCSWLESLSVVEESTFGTVTEVGHGSYGFVMRPETRDDSKVAIVIKVLPFNKQSDKPPLSVLKFQVEAEAWKKRSLVSSVSFGLCIINPSGSDSKLNALTLEFLNATAAHYKKQDLRTSSFEKNFGWKEGEEVLSSEKTGLLALKIPDLGQSLFECMRESSLVLSGYLGGLSSETDTSVESIVERISWSYNLALFAMMDLLKLHQLGIIHGDAGINNWCVSFSKEGYLNEVHLCDLGSVKYPGWLNLLKGHEQNMKIYNGPSLQHARPGARVSPVLMLSEHALSGFDVDYYALAWVVLFVLFGNECAGLAWKTVGESAGSIERVYIEREQKAKAQLNALWDHLESAKDSLGADVYRKGCALVHIFCELLCGTVSPKDLNYLIQALEDSTNTFMFQKPKYLAHEFLYEVAMKNLNLTKVCRGQSPIVSLVLFDEEDDRKSGACTRRDIVGGGSTYMGYSVRTDYTGVDTVQDPKSVPLLREFNQGRPKDDSDGLSDEAYEMKSVYSGDHRDDSLHNLQKTQACFDDLLYQALMKNSEFTASVEVEQSWCSVFCEALCGAEPVPDVSGGYKKRESFRSVGALSKF